MVKSKPSMTAAQRRMLDHVNEYIKETQPKIDQVINEVTGEIWRMYGLPEYVSDTDKARIRTALDNYEPTITEEEIADIVYSSRDPRSGPAYGEIIQILEDALVGTSWQSTVDFYIEWSTFKNMTEQRKNIIAGQLVMPI